MMDALVIGAGPAGLMAAEELALAGRSVVVADGKPSPARKFLMAGKSGLNVTKDEALPAFLSQFDSAWLEPMLAEFGPRHVSDWCQGLGQDVFTGSSGRVFPLAMKASPLLRAWLRRLDGLGVDLRSRWLWQGWQEDALIFATPDGIRLLRPKVTVLALGGASWVRLGSDAAWVPWLAERGVRIAPFRPANSGFNVAWSPHMTPYFGQPVKGAVLMAAGQSVRSEFILTRHGIEGGGVYALGRVLREGAALTLNLVPDLGPDRLEARIARLKRSDSLQNRLRKLGLSSAAIALVMEFGRTLSLQQALTELPVPLSGPRPIDEAISTAGGISRECLTEGLELRTLPGIFACGEMLDWDAPTGGYLLTACWATGRWAGRAAAKYRG